MEPAGFCESFREEGDAIKWPAPAIRMKAAKGMTKRFYETLHPKSQMCAYTMSRNYYTNNSI
jgi:hypothetical protein